MIIELLVTLFLDLATFLVSLLPDIDIPMNFILALGNIYDVMDGASYILPTGTFFACMTVFFLLHNLTLFVSIINWIIAKIPGIS